jgi:hypothetical protein
MSVLIAALLLVPVQSSSPESTVKRFAQAAKVGSAAEIRTLVKGASSNPRLPALLTAYKELLETTSVTELQSSESGGQATVTFRQNDGSGSSVQDSLKLSKSSGAWQIVPASDPDSQQKLSFSWYAALMASSYHTEGAIAMLTSVKCRNNCKQMGIAMLIYITDMDDLFKVKPSQSASIAAIKPYIKNATIQKCPATGRPYSFNVKLAGKDIRTIREPSLTVMFYEGANGKLDFAHMGKATVTFADSSTKQIAPSEVGRLRWVP